MVSVASLLNPAPPRAPTPETCDVPSSPVCLTVSSPTDESALRREANGAMEMVRDSQTSGRSRPKGVVNFPPFEDVDEATMHEIRRFRIDNFGSIRASCRRIPYNSGKKEFTQKTGRESFEVFQYEFKLPGDETAYTVMWDYHIGLVRMTPFFKCSGYPKTTPGKMLGGNPGLRDITHSITGGSIRAQGYWMPYQCAKAVCATFCVSIAGALVPLFGPDFPSMCVPRDSPRFQHMVIDQAIIDASTREARRFFHMSSPYGAPLTPRRVGSTSPRPVRQYLHSVEHRKYDSDTDRRLQHRTGLPGSAHRNGSSMDLDVYSVAGTHSQYSYQGAPTRYRSEADAALAVPRSVGGRSAGWTAVNRPQRPYYSEQKPHDHCTSSSVPSSADHLPEVPSPYLTALPSRRENRQHPYSRFPAAALFTLPDRRVRHSRGGEYGHGRSPTASPPIHIPGHLEHGYRKALPSLAEKLAAEDRRAAAEKDAALMLMTLSAPGSMRATESPSGDDGSPTQSILDRQHTPSSVGEDMPVVPSKPPSPTTMSKPSSPLVMASRFALPVPFGEHRGIKRRTMST